MCTDIVQSFLVRRPRANRHVSGSHQLLALLRRPAHPLRQLQRHHTGEARRVCDLQVRGLRCFMAALGSATFEAALLQLVCRTGLNHGSGSIRSSVLFEKATLVLHSLRDQAVSALLTFFRTFNVGRTGCHNASPCCPRVPP